VQDYPTADLPQQICKCLTSRPTACTVILIRPGLNGWRNNTDRPLVCIYKCRCSTVEGSTKNYNQLRQKYLKKRIVYFFTGSIVTQQLPCDGVHPYAAAGLIAGAAASTAEHEAAGLFAGAAASTAEHEAAGLIAGAAASTAAHKAAGLFAGAVASTAAHKAMEAMRWVGRGGWGLGAD
jgi:hypothetical protein